MGSGWPAKLCSDPWHLPRSEDGPQPAPRQLTSLTDSAYGVSDRLFAAIAIGVFVVLVAVVLGLCAGFVL